MLNQRNKIISGDEILKPGPYMIRDGTSKQAIRTHLWLAAGTSLLYSIFSADAGESKAIDAYKFSINVAAGI